MMSKQFEINAYDMLFFGTGRPFTMTETETWTEGIFPPMPGTVYGFLRGVYFENNMNDFNLADTEKDPTLEFHITDFHLRSNKHGDLYPLPYCFIKDKKTDKIFKLKLQEQELQTSSAFSHKLVAEKGGKLEQLGTNYYVTKADLEKFLSGKDISETVDIEEMLTPEDRLGISKNYRTGKAEDGRLYRIRMNNLLSFINGDLSKIDKISFRLELDNAGEKFPDKYIKTFGGEAKQGIIQEVTTDTIALPASEEIKDTALIYFATPGIFKDNYYPQKLFEDYGIEILFVANEKPYYVSGWDMLNRRPKPTKKVLPAGSLFFIMFNDNESRERFIKNFQGKQLPYDCSKKQEEQDYIKQAYNKIFIGNY